MATSNFHNVNATNIFAVSLEDDFDYYNLLDNLTYDFKSHKNYYDYGKEDEHELSSYPSKSLGSFSSSIDIGEDTHEVYVTPVIRSGYYEGCNLDWHVRCYVNGMEYDKEDATEVVNKLINEHSNVIEGVFMHYSMPLGVVARFSNGETIYSRV